MATSTYNIGAAVTGISFTATSGSSGFNGNGSGLTNLNIGTLSGTPSSVLVTNSFGTVTTSLTLASANGGLGINAGTSSGVPVFLVGTPSFVAATNSATPTTIVERDGLGGTILTTATVTNLVQ